LPLPAGHVIGVALQSDPFDLGDARGPVGAEYEPKHSGDEVVELAALPRIAVFLAVGAARITIRDAARPDFAPGGPLIAVTTRTPLFQISATRPAVKTAVRHRLNIRHDRFHETLLPIPGPTEANPVPAI